MSSAWQRQNPIFSSPLLLRRVRTAKRRQKQGFNATTVTNKPTCIDVPAGGEEQEDLKTGLHPGGWHDSNYSSVFSAARFLSPLSACCIASSAPPSSSSPPSPHHWRSHDLTLQPAGGSLHPLFNQSVPQCRAAVSRPCRAMHGQDMLLDADGTESCICRHCGAFCKDDHMICWLSCRQLWVETISATVTVFWFTFSNNFASFFFGQILKKKIKKIPHSV